MVKYLIILLLAISFSLIYWLMYYKRANSVLLKNNVKMYKVTPNSFLILILFVALMFGSTLSISNVYALEKELDIIQEHKVQNIYAEGEFSNNLHKYVYENYNQYFGGVFSENSKLILCIKDSATDELLSYLEDNSLSYVTVKHSYSELVILMQLIHDQRNELPQIITLSINEKSNSVEISTKYIKEVSDFFQTYIEDGILVINEGGEIIYQ